MAALARALGQGRAAALVAGLTYAGSGWVLTGLSFYNLLAVSAWWPLVLLGAARGGRRGVALGGIACGMALLAGEPVTAALGIVPLLLVALQRHGFRRGALTTPGHRDHRPPDRPASARGDRPHPRLHLARSASAPAAVGPARFHLGLARLLELIVPFPFGHPWDLGKAGYWPWDEPAGAAVHPHPALRDRRPLARPCRERGGRGDGRCSALAGLVLAWAGAFGGDALVLLSHGLVRYPEKLLFWFALAASLLAGWGLERVREAPRAWMGAALGAGGALAPGDRRLSARIADRRLAGGGASRSGSCGRRATDAGGVVDRRAVSSRRRSSGSPLWPPAAGAPPDWPRRSSPPCCRSPGW